MKIIKLGGSLFDTDELRLWLSVFVEASQNDTLIIVPGGGPFADQVRDAQAIHGFDDSTAHHMAILAMAQYGLMISALAPPSRVFYYRQQTAATLQKGLHIWIPDQQLLRAPSLSHSWDITSDSIALWLSQQLHADELVILKRATLQSNDLRELVSQGILDDGFQLLYQQQPVATRLFHFQQQVQFPNKGLILQ